MTENHITDNKIDLKLKGCSKSLSDAFDKCTIGSFRNELLQNLLCYLQKHAFIHKITLTETEHNTR